MNSTSGTASLAMTLMRSHWKILAVSLLGVAVATNAKTTTKHSNEREFYKLLKQYNNYNSSSNSMDLPDVSETQDYEMTLHRLHDQIQDLWYYASHEIKEAIAVTNNGKRNKKLKNLLINLENRKSALLGEQQRLRSVDGWAEKRQQEAAIASEIVQQRLRELHNPPDCNAARKIICYLNYACGFGCHIHHIAYCLKVAYMMNGLVILEKNIWRYKPSWRSLFEPLSEKCRNITYSLKNAVAWPLTGNKGQPIHVQEEPTIALGVPENLANRVMGFNADPGAWFLGQLIKYILRPRPEFKKKIDDTIARIKFQLPVVGVHVRRTDKLITEAKFHALQEYMQAVKEYWIAQDVARRPGTPPTPRRVYLACDDVAVFKEARRLYPGVKFIGDQKIASSAAMKDRWSTESLTGIVVDLILLSRSDYLVCTFTSNVGRAAYELMHGNRVDASESYVSLDNTYHFYGNYLLLVKQRHKSQRPQELSLEIGDLISRETNKVFNGYGLGELVFKNRTGLFPWYKVEYYPLLYNHSSFTKALLKCWLV